ncbi:MAG: ABC transporter permease [Thermodesulfobacteriota bacterium]
MLRYLAKRLLMMVPLLLGITLISFTVIHLAPGEPTGLATELNPRVTAEVRERLRVFYGLDKPLHEQYFRWLVRIVKLDFGRSFSPDRRLVIDKILERLPITVSLNVLSLLLIILIALPLGVLSATHQDTWLDRSTSLFVFIGFATPTFWAALLLMILFGVNLGWLPISGLRSLNFDSLTPFWQAVDLLKHIVLPVTLSALTSLAGLSRYMRSSMLEEIRQDYVTTARAKGLGERVVVYKHALRNALLPVITVLGLSLPALIGGSVIFESIFAINGMGKLFFDSVLSRDYPVVMGVLVMGAFLTLLGNLLADISYAWSDPRIRYD